MVSAPDPVDRFRAPLGWINDSPRPIGIAVSGGTDSLALLLLADAAWPGRVRAATVDHGLRPEAAGEARFVAGVCAGLAIPHAVPRPSTPISGSLQAAARTVRYALLEQWRAENDALCVMTAHHADDQAETMLMRLNRGAGVGGLAGIRAVNGHLVRPLLGWRRSELAAIVAAAGLVPVSDPSNADPRFDRVRIRSALARSDWINVPALAKSAAHLADAEEALAWSVARLAGERIAQTDRSLVLDPRELPEELVRRLLRLAVERLEPGATPSGPELDRLLATLRAGGKASLGGLTARGGESWHLAPAPARRAGV